MKNPVQTVEFIADSIVLETPVSEGIENIFLRFPKIELIHRKNLEQKLSSYKNNSKPITTYIIG